MVQQRHAALLGLGLCELQQGANLETICISRVAAIVEEIANFEDQLTEDRQPLAGEQACDGWVGLKEGPKPPGTPGSPRPTPAPERKQGRGYVGLWSFTIDGCRDTGDSFCNVPVRLTLSSGSCMAITMYFGWGLWNASNLWHPAPQVLRTLSHEWQRGPTQRSG